MYEMIGTFLAEYSTTNPLLWSILVMVTVAITALALYFFWQLLFSACRYLTGLFTRLAK